MATGSLLERYAAASRSVAWSREESGWTRTDQSLIGQQIWERRFLVGEASPPFLVTIRFDPHTHAVRTLYTSLVSGGSESTEVPTYVQRQANAFSRSLQDMARHPFGTSRKSSGIGAATRTLLSRLTRMFQPQN